MPFLETLLGLAVLFFQPAASPALPGPQETLACATDQLHDHLRKADPAYPTKEEKLEQAWAAQSLSKLRPLPPPFTLPVVFHLIHNNGPENIADADILRSLDYLNQSFANTDYYDQGTGVNTQIQFCLAQRTPDNQPTTGINRVVSSEYTDLEATAEDRAMKDLSRWEPREYINIWVVDEICGLGFGCGVAGYAYYPSAHGRDIDGIVVEARWLTTNEARASVLTHEMGHYLGLRHTFDGGCTNDDCTRDGDRVCDTPPDQSKAAVPCTGSANSCTTDTDSGFATDQDDMFINYMDYGYWRCYSAFTQGQADRMHFFIDGTRRSLLASPGCLPPCPAEVTAAFSGGDVTVEVGTTLNFLNNSANGTGYTWRVDGVLVASSFNFSQLFATEGTFTISLLADGSFPLCFPDSTSQTVRVVCSLQANFDASGPTLLNVPRTFTNQSVLADRYQWLLDGMPISTNEDLTYTFTTPGFFNLCLEAANDGCSRTACRFLFVNPPVDTTGGGDGECGESFAYSYQAEPGLQDRGSSFHCVVPDMAGGYYAAGYANQRPMVMHLAADGSILWQTQLFNRSGSGSVSKLILDEDGHLAGIGRASGTDPTGTRPSFLFQLDAATGNIRWSQEFLADATSFQLNDLVHARSGAPYTLIGETMFEGNNGFIVQIAADSGLPLTGWRIFFQNEYRFKRLIWDEQDAQIHVAAQSPSGNAPGWALLTFDATATFMSGTSILTGSTDNLQVAAKQDGDRTILVTNRFSAAGTPSQLELYQFDDLGALERSFIINTPDLQFVSNLEINTAGYLISTLGTAGTVLVQLDRTGNLLWSRSYNLTLTTFTDLDIHPTAMAIDGGILVAGDRPNNDVPGATFLKLLANGTAAGDCFAVLDYPVSVTSSQWDTAPWFGQAEELETGSNPFGAEPLNLIATAGNCRVECVEEICGNDLDDDGDGLVDCEDDDLFKACCCLPEPTFSLGPDSSFCTAVTRTLSLAGFDILFLSGQRTDTIVAANNSGGLLPLSFTEPGTYRLLAIDSCGRTAADTLTLHPRPRPLLDIGPDTTLCSNAVIPLFAQPGFASYEWVDGTTDPTFTAFEAGTYWVRAVDSCGLVQADTMQVFINPATVIDLGNDTLICPGDTLTFSLPNFSNYQWSESSYINCTTCSTVRFAPTADTLLLVAAISGRGCIASDSVRVRMISTVGVDSRVGMCMGDTLRLGQQVITTGGRYLDTVPVGNCFRVDTLTLQILRDTLVQDTLTICAGDSALVFGQFVTQPGMYTDIFPRANGCDSLRATQLVVNDTFLTTATVSICAGDSALIFGQFETAPGPYFSTISSVTGCDSTLRIDLEVTGLEAIATVRNNTCAGEDAGAAEVIVSQGNAPFIISWSNGASTRQIDGLAAGNYTVTITDATGCSATSSLSIAATPAPSLSLVVMEETCPGAADGMLSVTGDLADVQLGIEGQAGAGPVFSSLPPGNYLLQATTAAGCRQNFPFTIAPATNLLLDLPEELTLVFGDSVTLVPTTNLADLSQLRWTTANGLLCEGCPTLTIRPARNLTVMATLPGPGDCSVADTVVLSVEQEAPVYLPNAFSPNGDGVNDIFQVYPGPAVTEVLRLAVYDRWGGQVFLRDASDPSGALLAWDGLRPGGNPPSIGVYVYVVQLRLFTGEVIDIAGEVMVLR